MFSFKIGGFCSIGASYHNLWSSTQLAVILNKKQDKNASPRFLVLVVKSKSLLEFRQLEAFTGLVKDEETVQHTMLLASNFIWCFEISLMEPGIAT